MPARLDNLIKIDTNIEASFNSKTAILRTTNSSLAQLSVSQSIKAEVLSKLQDGSFAIKIENAILRANIPGPIQTGDIISLKVSSIAPNISFTIEQEGLEKTPIAISNNDVSASVKSNTPLNATQSKRDVASDENKLPTSPDNTDKETTSISNASKLIDIILHLSNTANSANSVNSQTVISSKIPLLNTAQDLKNPALAAQLIETQIGQSGVFYESHIVDWAEGTKTKTDLDAEPQARLPELSNQLLNSNNTELESTKELTKIIQQQLHTLENETIRWQGALFPGQKIDWEIRKETQHRRPGDGNAGDNEVVWQSTMQLSLPNLGDISAKFRIHGNHVNITISTDSEDTLSQLKSHAQDFSSTLSTLGTVLDGISIKYHEKSH